MNSPTTSEATTRGNGKASGVTPVIRIENAGKAFGDVAALVDVTLDIYENEFFALLGDRSTHAGELIDEMLDGHLALETGNGGQLFQGGDNKFLFHPAHHGHHDATGHRERCQNHGSFIAHPTSGIFIDLRFCDMR